MTSHYQTASPALSVSDVTQSQLVCVYISLISQVSLSAQQLFQHFSSLYCRDAVESETHTDYITAVTFICVCSDDNFISVASY